MKLDLTLTPFSYPGSSYAIRWMGESPDEPEGLYLCTARKVGWRSRIAKLDLLQDGEVRPLSAADAEPAVLEFRSGETAGQACFGSPTQLVLRAEGAGLRLTFVKPSHLLERERGAAEINCSAQYEIAGVLPLEGSLERHAEWDGDNAVWGYVDCLPDPETGAAEAVLELVYGASVWQPAADPVRFAAALAEAEQAYAAWRAPFGEAARPADRDAYDLAAYLHWSSVVQPSGYLTRGTVYSSMTGMAGIWSWDHCFHAMALIHGDPDLAWDQLMLMFDRQDRYGALPDCMTETYVHWGSTKPPIHGFALGWLMDRAPEQITDERLTEAYAPLAAWTDWWMTYRDRNGNGIPEYHNGNDCGWDNSTIFQSGVPLESPDLSAYLVLQMETLARVAERLSMPEQARDWAERAEELLRLMVERFRSGDRLRPIRLEGEARIASSSLLEFIPLLLGRRLPEDVASAMIQELRDPRFWTEYGWASEALDSPLYVEDGYWRGPVWAPPAFLLVHALHELGEKAFAREAAVRFLDTVSAAGMAENFSSRTGASQRDPAIVWTASAFMLLQAYVRVD
ncbi:hypothetical protein HGI30_08125 [Paenibacillus albicereus]|uniref:Mannosylglycerate hydrolase MGH1-like glycoside hydrolase domain-containing protein n=1 Tax=Paenibacillus albicereus TaxID=2726185 RepID=A0A6H2GVY6_9BACL|nr:hypothetical protein [Paenibacillus albicereus]QJC51519.1 hypothetical protein HGI30_08125 [Paenibacillus albicereus]